MTVKPKRRLELLLLGGVEARIDGISLPAFPYSKMWALLAYLAVEQGRDHQREVLAEMLWVDATARGNLRRTLSNLRGALEAPLGEAIFSAGRQAIRLLPLAHVDAVEFGRSPLPTSGPDEAERIANLYRGEFLAGLDFPGSPAFANWLQLKREELHRQSLALFERLSADCERIGRLRDALRFALRHTEIDPWNEDAHYRAMRLYAILGQKGAALAQYEVCCRELKTELGTLPKDKARRLAESIRNGELHPATPGAASVVPLALTAPPALERRQVTALYCELMLPEYDDPDETMALLQVPQARCAEAIRQYSGHVLQIHGGGLLAYFGHPRADEHAVRRAVQAALAMIDESDGSVDVRVGVHTGLAVTGGPSALPDMSGRTSNLAIQLRMCAPPNGVAISPETHAIAAGFFDCVSLGVQSLLGVDRPLEVFRPIRKSAAHTRVAAALVGRETELDALARHWADAAGGKGHAVMILGEAGIGKTRLLHTLKESLAGTPHVVRELRCFPEFSRSPFHPLIQLLETLLGFASVDVPEEEYRKLVDLFTSDISSPQPEAIAARLVRLLLLPPDDRFLPRMSAFELKERTLAMFLELLRKRISPQPLLFLVEDIQWADPSTLELLIRLVEMSGKDRVLAVFTARPELSVRWPANLVFQIFLKPLAVADIEAIVVARDGNIPPATIDRIVELSDGIPLFAEEMASMTIAEMQCGIPATLLDLLAARIDRLGEAKRTARLAAVLGREFDLVLLQRVSSESPEVLARHLEALRDAGLLFVERGCWQFKHALIREAAYRSQVKADRQSAHRRIARVLRSHFADIVSARPELLAQHLQDAGDIVSAIEVWFIAGNQAARRFASVEAEEHFKSALQLLDDLPEGRERDKRELDIISHLCSVLFARNGYVSEEATEIAARIGHLSERLGEGSDVFVAKWGEAHATLSDVGPGGMPIEIS
jgi:DNA-binding SARP family transcriptional activator